MMQPQLFHKKDNTSPQVFLAENPEATEPQSLGRVMAEEAKFFLPAPLQREQQT
jgi:hypothetical protein